MVWFKGWRGPYPGNGPFSYLPPWERPGFYFRFAPAAAPLPPWYGTTPSYARGDLAYLENYKAWLESIKKEIEAELSEIEKKIDELSKK